MMNSRLICLAVTLLVSGFLLQARPEVDRGGLRYGFSPRIKRFSWANLKFRVVNPDPVACDVEVRFVDSYRGAIGHKNVFTENVHVPAMTTVNFSSQVMSEDSEEYRLESFVDGIQNTRSDSFMVSIIAGDSQYITILNDHDDVSLGAFSMLPRFKGAYYTTSFSAKDPPGTWELLKKSACVVVLRPDFSRYSPEAFQAILDYVCQGGHLLFADPEGAAEAYYTPLAELLPVVPLRFRRISGLESLSAIYPDFSTFCHEVSFLEALPLGEGVTILEERGIPVFRWKKFGLGTSRFSALPLTADSLGANWPDIFEASVYVPKVVVELSEAVPALDEMAGFVVPGIEALRKIFLVYFVLVALPIGLGIYFRRTGIAWFTTAFATIALTAYILKAAAAGHSEEKGIFLSFIETTVYGPSSSPGDGLYGIFSTSDGKLSVGTKIKSALLSCIPPPDNIMAMYQKAGESPFSTGSAFTPPTEVYTAEGVSRIKDMSLNSHGSRQFYASYNSLPDEYFVLPELSYEKDGFKFASWKLPDAFNPDNAWLQFPNGVVPLDISAGEIILSPTSKAPSSDATLLAVQRCVKEAWRRGSPFLMLVENSQENNVLLPGDVISNGKRLSIIPLRERASGRFLTVPPQSILISAGDTSTRMIMLGNAFKRGLLARSDSDYIVRFQLPPVFMSLKAERVVVEMKVLNEGANVSLTPVLMKGSLLENKFHADGEKAGKLEDGKYVFSDVGDFIRNGTGFINVKVGLKRTNLPIGEALRANTWTMDSFDISVSGSMPENIASFEF
ncbi:MAG: hypothetical protein JW808_02935 [Victivallales bacterium]|nr:hypothetical protein [Victivallales bacterium]